MHRRCYVIGWAEGAVYNCYVQSWVDIFCGEKNKNSYISKSNGPIGMKL